MSTDALIDSFKIERERRPDDKREAALSEALARVPESAGPVIVS